MPLMEVQNLTKVYNKRAVVDNVSFGVNAGEIVGLLGPNGAGKTTTFRMTVGLITPNSGRVIFNGEDITRFPMYRRARRGIGYLSQETSVFQRLTVEENILAVLEAMKLPRAERYRRTHRLLDELELTKLATNKANTLSGGERRRLEITRALVSTPSLLLLDEPFSGVDPIAVFDIQQIILSLKERGIGILLTDHSVRETLSISDRSYIINEGSILTSGTSSELVNDPLARKVYLGGSFRADGFRKVEAAGPGTPAGDVISIINGEDKFDLRDTDTTYNFEYTSDHMNLEGIEKELDRKHRRGKKNSGPEPE